MVGLTYSRNVVDLLVKFLQRAKECQRRNKSASARRKVVVGSVKSTIPLHQNETEPTPIDPWVPPFGEDFVNQLWIQNFTEILVDEC